MFTIERTPTPQQHHWAAHQETHSVTDNYITNIENNQPAIYTVKDLPTTEYNNQIEQQQKNEQQHRTYTPRETIAKYTYTES